MLTCFDRSRLERHWMLVLVRGDGPGYVLVCENVEDDQWVGSVRLQRYVNSHGIRQPAPVDYTRRRIAMPFAMYMHDGERGGHPIPEAQR